MTLSLTTRRRGARFAVGALTGAVVVGLAISALTVAAGKPRLDSNISYTNSIATNAFIHEGQVRSSSQACERGRTVLLYGEGIAKPFDSDRTDAQGRYRFVQGQDGIASDYYTRVQVKETPSAICKAAESKHKPLS